MALIKAEYTGQSLGFSSDRWKYRRSRGVTGQGKVAHTFPTLSDVDGLDTHIAANDELGREQ